MKSKSECECGRFIPKCTSKCWKCIRKELGYEDEDL